MEKVLQVKNLSINFRTINGQVQAVRDVSFDLHKGETMAIVGESGSGKSVTSRAILGILAKNAIVKGGKIYYDGQDLLRITEDDFHKIRGDKIAMIFQDPMSSLNPIMRIGKQLTEAMILKNKSNRRESRKKFNSTMAKLVKYMDLAVGEKEISNAQKSKDFNTFEYKHLDLENAYNEAKANGEEILTIAKNLYFEVEKKSYVNVKRYLVDVCKLGLKLENQFYVSDKADVEKIELAVSDISSNLANALKTNEFEESINNVKIIESIIISANQKKKPNFFSLGYYLAFVKDEIPTFDIDELDKITHKHLDDEFMLEFISRTEKALEYSYNESIENTKTAKDALEEFYTHFNNNDIENLRTKLHDIISKVENSIDKLDIYRKASAYTFKTSILESFKLYLNVDNVNANIQAKYDKSKASYDNIVAKGKTPSWNLPPIALWDKDLLRNDIDEILQNMISSCESYLNSEKPNFNKKAIDIIDYFKENASNVVNKVTKRSAKVKAIKLMEEVGIPEPYKRYRQYPFEFSGGMRQRIVIAIALAANPQILICDEPTTALDVTIQSQILELINKLKEERNLSIIFITHDMGVVANMADKISVMYAGKIVETGTCDDIFYDPKHPYTWALLSSMPDLDTKEKLDSIPGTPPNMINPPVGDAFAARNKYAMKIDFERQPPMFKVSDTHYAATWLLHKDAPKVEMPKTLLERIERMKKVRDESNGK